ncbi:MAG: lamin tail domain-containing protein [Phycisphaeraceae bacterium]|nr:MAG: lamin tail domain-containing protein [Phycisphaeraceae bacterium]
MGRTPVVAAIWFLVICCAGGATAQPVPALGDEPPPVPVPKSPVAYPHPLITEILYAVPTKNGDANRDGERQTTGDEFVELINPHDRAIRISGYTLHDSAKPGRTQFRFTFPQLTLQPGQVVVVFNGHDSKLSGESDGTVGDGATPPKKQHPDFGNAWVFTARAPSTRAGFANGGDWVMLLDPRGEPVQCAIWGDAEKPVLPDGSVCVVELVTDSNGVSAQRRGLDGPFEPHPPYRASGLGADAPLMPFSPGVFVVPGLTRLEDMPPYKGER